MADCSDSLWPSCTADNCSLSRALPEYEECIGSSEIRQGKCEVCPDVDAKYQDITHEVGQSPTGTVHMINEMFI